MTKPISRASKTAVLLTSGAIASSGLAGWAGSASASQGTPPPWAPAGVSQDANAVGGIEFVNAAGTQITTGSINTAPFATYAIGLHKTRTTVADTKATLYAYVPQPGQTPDQWSTTEQIGLSTDFPVPTAHAPANSTTLPVQTGSATDLKLATIASDLPNTSTTTGYVNTYEIRMYTGAKFQPSSTTYDYTDITINTATGIWTEVFSPDSAISTAPPASSLTINKSLTINLGASTTIGTALKVVSSAAAIPSATVVLKSRTSTTGTWATLKTLTTSSTGVASYSAKPSVTTYYEWTYAGSATHGAATSPTETVTVHIPAPTTLSIGKSVTIKKGKTTVIGTHLLDAKTKAAIKSVPVILESRTSTSKPFAAVKTFTTTSTGLASYTVKPSVKTYYEWVYAGNADHAKSTSATETVTVS